MYSKKDVLNAYDNFVHMLENKNIVACLFIAPLPDNSQQMQTENVIKYLAELFCILNESDPNNLVNGSSLNLYFKLKCPVTGEVVEFGDFDGIAFCPQANDIDDPLYDPMMSAPYPCANITSDIFVFSLFTNDMSL